MLDTIYSYIDTKGSGLIGPRPKGRFPSILAVSAYLNAFFYIGIIVLSWWTYSHWTPRKPVSQYSVKIIDITKGPAPDFQLRLPPEALNRADLNHLKNNPEEDDTSLAAKSPNPGSGHGAGVEAGARRGNAKKPDTVARNTRTDTTGRTPMQTPPGIPVIQPSPVQPQHQTTSDLPIAKADQPPPPPAEAHKGATNSHGEHGEGSANSSELSFRTIESQYRAFVRAKIYKTNQSIMPRSWIETTLNRKVSADYIIIVDRSGKLASIRLARSSGYDTLDGIARQAIVLASPFEGFPTEAPGTLEFTVTVTYTPYGY